MEIILIVIGLFVVFFLSSRFAAKNYGDENELLNKRITALNDDLRKTNERLNQADQEKIQLRKQITIQEGWIDKKYSVKKQILNEIEKHLRDRAALFNWLSPLIADIHLLTEDRLRDDTDFVKTKRNTFDPAWLRVETLLSEKKQLANENKYLKYNLEYIKTLIPEIDGIIEDDEYKEELRKEDNPKKFIPKYIYDNLSDTERNIMAFDNYKKRKKSNWEIGRDYEMYIGYRAEKNGWDVEYFGIEKKLEDLGRDLISKRDNKTMIVQCKRWAENKIIHEKHIAQLFGTVEIYKFENPEEKNVKGIFITTAKLSEKAKEFARILNIEIKENEKIGEYPMIKCHNGKGNEYGDRKKIYHLPMDQQYDNTIINKKKGDFYAFTVEEAEKEGYVRAYRWHARWEDNI